MDEVVRQLAQNEWAASQERKRAETAWRSAWWETTFALAELSNVKEGYDAAMAELGQGRDHLMHRRRVGIAVDPSCRQEAHRLPPTLSLNWVREGRNRIDSKAVTTLLQADEEHVSTRQFIEQIARPSVRRTPVPPPSLAPRPVPVVEPDPTPVPDLTPVSLDGHGSDGHRSFDGPSSGQDWPPPPPRSRPDTRPPVTPAFQPTVASPQAYALQAALLEIQTMTRAMNRLDELIPKLDDETRPQFRARLLELDVKVQMMIEGLNPESSMAFTERDEVQLLGGQG